MPYKCLQKKTKKTNERKAMQSQNNGYIHAHTTDSPKPINQFTNPQYPYPNKPQKGPKRKSNQTPPPNPRILPLPPPPLPTKPLNPSHQLLNPNPPLRRLPKTPA